MSPGLRRLYQAERAQVEDDAAGVPRAVEGVAVDAVREEWWVEDRWWELRPLRRRYFDLALADGRSVVVFYCLLGGRWYRQRA